jgi:hypothetical protein
MMKSHEGCERGFYILSESWYADSVKREGTIDEIMIGMYHPDGGSTGEFAVRWIMLANKATPRLEAYDDSWSALQNFRDMLNWMESVDNQNISPKSFAEALRNFGVKDLTKRESPYRPKPKSDSKNEKPTWRQDHEPS